MSLQRARVRPPGVTTEEPLLSGFRFAQQTAGAPVSKQRPKARSSGFRITRTEQASPPIITAAGIPGLNDASNPWCTYVDFLTKVDYIKLAAVYWHQRHELPTLIHVYWCRRILHDTGHTVLSYLTRLKGP